MLRKINLLIAITFMLGYFIPAKAQDSNQLKLPKILKAHCHCRVAPYQGSDISSVNNVFQNFGDIKEYSGLFPMNDGNRADCQIFVRQPLFNGSKLPIKMRFVEKREVSVNWNSKPTAQSAQKIIRSDKRWSLIAARNLPLSNVRQIHNPSMTTMEGLCARNK